MTNGIWIHLLIRGVKAGFVGEANKAIPPEDRRGRRPGRGKA